MSAANLVLSLFPGIGLLDSAFEAEGWCVVRGPDVLWGGDVRRFFPPASVFGGVIGGPPCQTFSSLAHLVRANGHEPRFGNLIPEFERCVLEAAPVWFLMENVPQAPEPFQVPNAVRRSDGLTYAVKSFLLDNSALDAGDGFGHEQRRVRRFSFGVRGDGPAPDLRRWIDLAVFVLPDAARNVAAGTGFPHDDAFKARVPPLPAGHEQPAGLTDRKRRVRSATAVSGSNGGNGDQRIRPGAGNSGKGRYKLADALRLQGLPPDFLQDAPFTADGKLKAVANGVPIPMGRAVARAVCEAMAEGVTS